MIPLLLLVGVADQRQAEQAEVVPEGPQHRGVGRHPRTGPRRWCTDPVFLHCPPLLFKISDVGVGMPI